MTTTDQEHREQVIAMAGRVASLASESLRRARHDIEASRRHGRPLGSRGRPWRSRTNDASPAERLDR